MSRAPNKTLQATAASLQACRAQQTICLNWFHFYAHSQAAVRELFRWS